MPREGSASEISNENFQGRWLLLFWYPLDFTFICPTEIIAFSDRQVEFNAINTQIVAVSCDSFFSHLAWTRMSRAQGGLGEMNIPIVSDFDKKMSTAFGVLLPSGEPLRACLVISPEGVLRQITLNDHPVGRSVDEMLRLVKAFQFTDEFGDVCPAGWQPGAATITPDPEASRAYFQQEQQQRKRQYNEGTSGALEPGATTPVRFQPLALRHSPSSSSLPFSFSRSAKSLLTGYQSLLQERPLQTKAVTSCVISLLGELIGTYIKRRRTPIGQVPPTVDWRRMGIFGFYGFAVTGERASPWAFRSLALSFDSPLTFSLSAPHSMRAPAGPLFHWWYKTLETLVARRQLPPRISVALKILLDRLLLTPPFLLFSLGFLQYFQTLDAPQTVASVKNMYAVALWTNWRVWTPAQLINFAYVPLQYRVLFGNLVALWWNVHLSLRC